MESKQDKHVTQTRIAKMLGVADSTVSEYFLGKYDCGKKLARAIEAVTRIPWRLVRAMTPEEVRRELETILERGGDDGEA